MDKKPEPQGTEHPGARGAGTVTALFGPALWDICDEEISEWQQPGSGRVLPGLIAAAIRDGRYDGGKEIFAVNSKVRWEVTREAIDKDMEVLRERGMVRKSGPSWYAITPGRPSPTARRAVTVLLACREELPPALATELKSYKALLDGMHPQSPGGRLASQGATGRALASAKPAREIAAVSR